MKGNWKPLVVTLAATATAILIYSVVARLNISKTATGAENRKAESAVREPAVAGQFYPADPKELEAKVKQFLAGGEPLPADAGRAVALIAPHAGYPFSGSTAGKAFRTVEGMHVKRVIVLGVSHYTSPAPAWIDAQDAYRTPLGDVAVDVEARSRLKDAGIPMLSGFGAREHSIEVELPFLQVALGHDWKFVPILVGSASLLECAEIAKAVNSVVDDSTLVCVSSDFTHYGEQYGYVPFTGSDKEVRERITDLDGGAIKFILAKDAAGFAGYVEKTGATICGRAPITILLNMLPQGIEGRKIAYTMSGDITGGFSMSVSYAAIVFTAGKKTADPAAGEAKESKAMSEPKQLTADEKKTLLTLARRSLEVAVIGEKPLVTSDLALTDALREKRGAFVTLEIGKSLRGCIGYVEAIKPLWQTVAENARNAAEEDPRFHPVTTAEVPKIHIEISAMTPLEKITDVKKIEVGKHGIMLTRGFYRGLLLPQVATEYGWNRDEFLIHTCEKAGLPDDAWKDRATKIEIFSAEVFGEEAK
jgi:MEMO1 family protein